MRGVVYFLINGAMPGLVKVGRTTGNPYDRAFDLSRPAGVPEEFRVLAFFQVDDCIKKEALIHQMFDEFRNSDFREFFLMDANCISLAFQYLSIVSSHSMIDPEEISWFNKGCIRAGITSGFEVPDNG